MVIENAHVRTKLIRQEDVIKASQELQVHQEGRIRQTHFFHLSAHALAFAIRISSVVDCRRKEEFGDGSRELLVLEPSGDLKQDPVSNLLNFIF